MLAGLQLGEQGLVVRKGIGQPSRGAEGGNASRQDQSAKRNAESS